MNDLIKRLEEATEGSRALDALICVSEGYDEWTPEKWAKALQDMGEGSNACPVGCPPYTTSLDTAVTLVPEGIAWTVSKLFNKRFWASCDDPENYDNSWAVSAEKPTPALAICIAALRARLVMENSTPD